MVGVGMCGTGLCLRIQLNSSGRFMSVTSSSLLTRMTSAECRAPKVTCTKRWRTMLDRIQLPTRLWNAILRIGDIQWRCGRLRCEVKKTTGWTIGGLICVTWEHLGKVRATHPITGALQMAPVERSGATFCMLRVLDVAVKNAASC